MDESHKNKLAGKLDQKLDEKLEGELKALRDGIDSLDSEILQLLGKRANLAKRVGNLKQTSGWSYHVPERERFVIERVKHKAADYGFPEAAIASIYREIMSACLRLESPITVAYLGPGSTFSYFALRRVFGDSAKSAPERTIDEVFDAIEGDRADYAIVPIENSFEGTVHESMQRLIKTQAFVHGEYYLSIEHALLGAGPDHSKITRVFSHPQAFLQCRGWLRSHLPAAELVATTSTAQACKDVARDEHWAAIANAAAAPESGLNVLARNIQDKGNNETRFLVLAREQKLKARQNDKSSIIFSVPHLSGKLYQVLQVLGSEGINVLKLEAVPDRSMPWKAYFWMDTDGLHEEASRQRIFDLMKVHCDLFHHIGTYSRLE
jgi:chorismate mutase/prephenate dehydratase